VTVAAAEIVARVVMAETALPAPSVRKAAIRTLYRLS
jgi:hypothetical protein